MAVMSKYYKVHTDGCTVELEPIFTELAPVVHGRWEDDQYYWKCSVCLEWLEVAQGTAGMNYCPNCGAKMDLEVDGDG